MSLITADNYLKIWDKAEETWKKAAASRDKKIMSKIKKLSREIKKLKKQTYKTIPPELRKEYEQATQELIS